MFYLKWKTRRLLISIYTTIFFNSLLTQTNPEYNNVTVYDLSMSRQNNTREI